MWKTRKIIALLILLTVPGTLPIVAHSAGCFDSVFLGQYVLGNWNGPGPNSDSERWDVGGIVGTNESFATKKELRVHMKEMVEQCSVKGAKIIADAERHMMARKDTAVARFEEWCNDPIFCPAIRNISINYERNQIDKEIERMKTWYGGNIKKCKKNFRDAFREISKLLFNELTFVAVCVVIASLLMQLHLQK